MADRRRSRRQAGAETTSSSTSSALASAPVPTASPQLAAVESALGYRFQNPVLLQLALTHRSYTYEASTSAASTTGALPTHPGTEPPTRNQPGTDNEQLEFLGDAVLGLAVTDSIVREFPHCDEGELTRLRSALVSRKRMAQLGEELGLAAAVRLGVSAERNGGRAKPALLANAAEAVLAAVYLDLTAQGANALAQVQAIVDRLVLAPELEAMRAELARAPGRSALRDPKSILQERVQAAAAGRIRYVDTAETGPAHHRRFSVEAHLEGPHGTLLLAAAEGSSKKEAQQRAAELALASGLVPVASPAPPAQPAQGPV